MKVSVYTRQKNDAGQWRYRKVKLGRGHRTSSVSGPFYLRFSTDGRKIWEPAGDSLEAATEAAEMRHHALEAHARGLYCGHAHVSTNIAVPPADDPLYANQKLERDERLGQLKSLAQYFPDPDPQPTHGQERGFSLPS